MRITNKKLIEQKEKRYMIFTFDKNGLRKESYGNATIIDVPTYLFTTTPYNDVLLMEYDEAYFIEVVTCLENQLHRRATKEEVFRFINRK